MAWDVAYTHQFGDWLWSLAEEQQDRVAVAVDELVAKGPALGRPHADTIEGSRIQNLKELRAGNFQIFFVFDPRRTAILLNGGDKRNRWESFYDEMIPQAERLYEEHLRSLREEGMIQ
jgi:hypothetical protein